MKFSAKAAAAICALLAGTVPSMAHHSFAMFDLGHFQTLTGTIKEFQWTNPHTIIWVNVPDGKGGVVTWAIEGLSPGNLVRRGWTKHTLNPGDGVSVKMHPLRDGMPGGGLNEVTLLDTGKVLRQDLIPPGDPFSPSAPPPSVPAPPATN